MEVGLNHTRQGRGVSCYDYDRDGRIDVFIGHSGEPLALFRNRGDYGHHFLTIKLSGTRLNPDGIGARIQLSSGGMIQTREIRQGSNYLSNDPPLAHFGVGRFEIVDWLEVRWPDGTVQRLEDVPVNEYRVVTKVPSVPAQ